MATFAELQQLKSHLIHKVLDASLFVAPRSAPLIEAITDDSPGGLLSLPTGYEDIGRLDKDAGISFPREVNTEDVMSIGAGQPVRRDVISDITTVSVTAQETKRAVLESYYGIDLSGIEADATTGEVSFARPDRPATRYVRVLALGKDGEGADAVYIARFLPRMSMTSPGEQMFKDTDALVYPLEFTSFVDDVAGFSERVFFGGPGWLAALEDYGFPQAPATP